MRSTRALSISVGTHCVVLALLLLAFKHELLHKTPERQKSLPHQARVLLQNNKSSPIVPMPPDNPAPPSAPASASAALQQPVTTPPVAAPTPAPVPHAPPSHSEQARKPLAKTHAQGNVPVVTEDTSTPPSQQQTPALRPVRRSPSVGGSPQGVVGRMHAWKRAAQAQPPARQHTPAPANRTPMQESPYLHHALRAKPTEQRAEQQSEASRAHAAAARFHNDYARKQLEEYIYSIVYAVGCTYNSSPFLLTANDVPYELSFIITLDRKGQLLSVTTDRPCPTARGEEWRKHVIACFYRAAPFRATPAQVPDPWTIPLRTDFESEFLSNTSSQPRPVIFRLTRAPY